MTPRTRVPVRRLAVTAGCAAFGYAVSGASARQMLRAPLALLAVASVGNLMAQASTASKTRAVEARLNAHVAAAAPAVSLVANGGSIGGNLTVNGNHTVTGNINGTGSIGGSGAQFNGGGATLSGGISSGGNINASSGNITAGGNVSDSHQSNIGTVVSGLPLWVFSSTKCATVTAIGTGHTVDQVEGMCADVIHALKSAGHMS